MDFEYRQCAISVMDNISDPNITFDEKGICNYYYEYLEAEKQHVIKGEEGIVQLEKISEKIRQDGTGKPYDCIMGLSGGVDSTYLCLLAKRLGLRPLIVHFDNGWNSELAVNNIENTVKKLDFDLFTYVVDWPEFRELQLSYLKASVVDIEVLTDHAFMAVLYEQAKKRNLKYVLAGMNIVTEQVLPKHWIFSKADSVNIKDIQKKFGRMPLSKFKSFPFLDYKTKRYCEDVLKMEVVTPLNYVEYVYDHVKQTIISDLGWRDYGGKHYESVWTRFYQGFILPEKFKIDKRKAHFSNLIFSGQMTKEEALEKLKEAPYDPVLKKEDKEFVIKKFGLSEAEFNDIMNLPRREHSEFETLKGFYDQYPVLKPLKPVGDFIKKVLKN